MRFYKRNKRGMFLLDLITSLIIIWFLIWVFGGIIGTLSRNAREIALRYQLSNLRMLVTLYKDLKGQYPEDLKVLIQSSHKFNANEIIFSDVYVSKLEQDAQGAPIDSFGNRLYYDPRKGVVGSQTKGYQGW